MVHNPHSLYKLLVKLTLSRLSNRSTKISDSSSISCLSKYFSPNFPAAVSRTTPSAFPPSSIERHLFTASNGTDLIKRVAPGTGDMVVEEDVGILCYINTIRGFRGTLKQRFSDFVVHEVSSSGVVIRLTSMDPPLEEVDSNSLSVSKKIATDITQEKVVPDNIPEKAATDNTPEKVATENGPEKVGAENAEHVEFFRSLVGDDDAGRLEVLLKSISEKEGKDLPPVLLSPDSDKQHRAAVHDFFKRKFPYLVTDTVDGPGEASSKCVRIHYFVRGSGDSRRGRGSKRNRENTRGNSKRQNREQYANGPITFDNRGRDDWPSSLPKFLLFHLCKENKNTQDALMVIGNMLGIKPRSFGFAGTKDKRAVTTQQVTLFKQSATKLAALNSRLLGMKVGNFSYVEKALGLGELSGNLFTITLRNVVVESDKLIDDAAHSLKERGFVNYYGLQRFGNSSVATHTVGAALLRGEWKNAVDLVLQPRDGEMAEISEARNYFQRTQSIDGALSRFPRQMGSERALLGGLKKQPGNFLMAFNCIPRPMRLMFVHSYQSYLWNHAASYRLRTYGVEMAVEGDLVYCDEVEQDAASKSLVRVVEDSTIDGPSVAQVEVEEELGTSELDFVSEGLRKVKLVTAEDVLARKYTIADVVLPLPGSSVMYPTNSTALVYQDVASKDSVDLSSSRHNVKDYSISHLSGGYRHLVQALKDFDWKIMTYDDITVPLIETDIDKITKFSSPGESQQNRANGSKMTSNQVENGALKALLLTFTLPASSYATMAIRELLKTSTSVAFHRTLN